MSVIDFNGFDKGVIGKKLPSDTTLNNMRKADLIELLHLAESNHRVLAEAYKIAVDTSKCNSCPLSINGEESYKKGRADAIEELYDLTEKALKHHADNFIKFGNGAGRRNGQIMAKWLFEYFLELKIEAEKILEQLKEKKE